MKQYTIIETRNRRGELKTKEITGTLEYLVQYFGYTLEVGRSWEREPGNRKVNTNPKSGRALCTSLNRAVDNAACNGYSGTFYSLKED